MISNEVANRYAAALFSMSSDSQSNKEILSALHQIADCLTQDDAIAHFIQSPLIRAEDKEQALKRAFKDQNIDTNLLNFILLLAKKDRLSILKQIVAAYETKTDESNHLKRGTIRSAGALDEKQKAEIQKIIENFTKTKVILTYQEDSSLVGGLIAQVGSLTIDDSLFSHLNRIKEDLNRSH
jgi:F-type H+-transporting ATPase subunit delta